MSKYPEQGLTHVAVSDLGWLTGNWLGRVGDDVVEEHWSALGGGTLMSMFRWQKEGQVWFYEFVTIEPAGEQIMLRI